MKSELEKMLSGELYNSADAELANLRNTVREHVARFNNASASDYDLRNKLQNSIFGSVGNNVTVEQGLRVDYGLNTSIGNNVFINFNFILLDCAKVIIGDNVFIGPNVQLYTATHPLEAKIRAEHVESALPIEIGNDVWIGGGSIILPNVKIGSGTTIGAGSVVTKDIPSNVLAYGSPCKVIKEL